MLQTSDKRYRRWHSTVAWKQLHVHTYLSGAEILCTFAHDTLQKQPSSTDTVSACFSHNDGTNRVTSSYT